MAIEAKTIRGDYRYNIARLLSDYAFFGIGFGLMDPNTIIPAFAGQLTDSQILIGISGLLMPLGWLLPQLFAARPVSQATRKKGWMVRPILISRVGVITGALLITLLPPMQKGAILVVLFATCLQFAIGDGIGSVAWFDIVSRAVTNQHRGWMFGIGQVLTAIGMLPAAELARYILGPTGPAFPDNYAMLLLLSGLLLLAGGLNLAMLREPPVEKVEKALPLHSYLPYLGRLWQNDPAFRRFLIVRGTVSLSFLATPFFIGFALAHSGLDPEVVISSAMVIGTLSKPMAALVMGWLYEHTGSKAVIQLLTCSAIAAPLSTLLALVGPGWISMVSFAAVGITGAGFSTGYMNWLMEHSPEEKRAVYIGLSNTVNGITVAAPLLGGVLLEATGYAHLFGVALALGAIGAWLAFGLEEPRRSHSPAR